MSDPLPAGLLFSYYEPTAAAKGMVSVPHPGEWIPDEFAPLLTEDAMALMEDVDFRIHELLDIPKLRGSGIAVLISHIQRVAVDLNREKGVAVLNWQSNSQGTPLVTRSPGEEQRQKLLAQYYHPYFNMIDSFFHHMSAQGYSEIPFIDFHSMPSRPTAYHLKQNPQQSAERPEVCLSDQKGQTCRPAFIEFVKEQLGEQGIKARVNDPYVGGFITRYVNQFPAQNIQIEVNRQLYMDEQKKELIPAQVEKLKDKFTHTLLQTFETFPPMMLERGPALL